MEFKTIEEIKNHRFVGNHWSDHKAFDAIDKFAQDTNNSISDRAEALRQMSDKGMGCGRSPEMTDLQLLEELEEYWNSMKK